MPGHLTSEERDRIAQMRRQGAEQKAIAEALGRSESTISRELRRNAVGGEYHAAQAQHQAERRRRERPLSPKMENPEINRAVRRGLASYWSPEQIAGRFRQETLEPRDRVSAQTIYAWIEQDDQREHWKSFLRRRGRPPRRRKNTAKTSPGAPIDQRPEEIEQRFRLGDFEGDTILGPPGTGGLVTLVDRRSRYTIIVKIRSKHADHVHQKIKRRMRELDEDRRHSLTLDNGKEFARCHRLEKHLGVDLYFSDPGCPYQRGSNENTNGLIRQFFPKGTDFRTITHCQVRDVENLLNDRPRACLDYRSPAHVFFQEEPNPDCV